jgi:DNA-binding transcriptional LysR family regulator
MELRHLRYFVAVAEAGAITRAAARLGLQQPPLSQQIKALEDELGIRLFNRTPRGVSLTAGGDAFLDDARAILSRVEAAADHAVSTAAGTRGNVTIGFTRSISLHPFAPRVIREFACAHPEVVLNFREGNAAELTDAIATGNIAIAFVHVPVAQPPGLVFDHLLDEDMLVALPRGHTLAQNAASSGVHTVALSALANDKFILVRRPGAPGMYANLITACNRVGFTPQVAAQVGSMLANIMLVAAGVGVSVVPASMRGTHSEHVFYGTLSDTRALAAPITMVHRASEDNPVVQRFMSFCRTLLATGV